VPARAGPQRPGAGDQVPLPEFFGWARQLCRAISQIHQHRIVHRDISATNIWLDARHVTHLGDFDTAFFLDDPQPAAQDFSTTESYPAPELFDAFERAFRQGLTNGLDPDANHLVTISFPTVQGIQICRADVKPAPRPVFLVSKGAPPEFRVRKGNASPALTIKDAYEYISHHWGWATG